VPVTSSIAYDHVKQYTDELVCLITAHVNQFAVAGFYRRWYDLTDEEVFEYFDKWHIMSKSPIVTKEPGRQNE